MEAARKTIRRILPALAYPALLFGIWDAYCAHFSFLHLRKGDVASAAGNKDLSRLEWESAASRPAPWNPFSRKAMGRLVSLERGMETEGRHDEALRLCFSIRGIAESTAGYWNYYAREKEFATSAIPRLAKRLGTEILPDRYPPSRPLRPVPAHLALFSFACFFLAMYKAARNTDRGRRTVLYCFAAALFAAWLILLRFA